MSEQLTLERIAELRGRARRGTVAEKQRSIHRDDLESLCDLAGRALMERPRLTHAQVCELTRWIVDVGGIGYSDSLRNRLRALGIEVEPAPPEAKV